MQSSQANRKQIKVIPLMMSLLICGFMGMFSETALNIALRGLMIEFQISASTVQWLTTSYLLVLGILIPISGLLIKRFPTRNLFITGVCFSVIGLFIAATSSSFVILLIGRIVQATGTGLITPLLFNTVLVIFPIQKRGTAMGIVGLVLMFAPAIGPMISGFIIQQLDWHWIFWIPIPFYLLALALGIVYLIDLSTDRKPNIDMLSIIFSTMGFGGLVFGFSRAGENEGWTSLTVLIPLVVGVTSLILFVIRQLSLKEPILNVRVFTYPMFRMGIGLTVLSNMIIFSSTLLLPMFMQGALGFTSAEAGLYLLAGGVCNGIMALLNGRIFDKYGPRRLVIPGFVLATISVIVFTNLSTTINPVIIIIFHTLLMVGMSMTTTPSQTNGLNQLPRSMYPDGSAIVNTTIQTCGAIGTAIGVSILNASQRTYLDQANHSSSPEVQIEALVSGVQHAYIFASIVAVIGLICSLFIKRVIVGDAEKRDKQEKGNYSLESDRVS
ncbi:DHA2 family efflux MFS transporter permease subunit [Paenibacillus sp. SC116]|uniref:DHA2 family efflux MFS transporter permease subunit n=1 Tax=Paenibacillus sp. SC116 TaxID=2968986 RepID=UPI00215AF5EE|nr:DHA2 family efflux MFS transporter permease subunit [Paenibacillus sp. SC116]MCR8842402.1 DHA2 family efflux MFS transporter permease subunit [Paenibacillus sp. SC116]